MDLDIWEIESDRALEAVVAAREYCENHCDRAFAEQQWRVTLDSLDELTLPGGVIQSVDSITYTDSEGAEQTVPVSVYTVSRKGRLRLNNDQSWPDHTPGPESVSIVYTVGSDRVPHDVVQAMYMLLSHYFEERRTAVVGASAQELPLGVNSLLWPHRMIGV
tara:strand:- start:28 stop:513 length:486 start_codon:yes stop_codon:yes gene_type:complete